MSTEIMDAENAKKKQTFRISHLPLYMACIATEEESYSASPPFGNILHQAEIFTEENAVFFSYRSKISIKLPGT